MKKMVRAAMFAALESEGPVKVVGSCNRIVVEFGPYSFTDVRIVERNLSGLPEIDASLLFVLLS